LPGEPNNEPSAFNLQSLSRQNSEDYFNHHQFV
jgi:hypothetical protein